MRSLIVALLALLFAVPAIASAEAPRFPARGAEVIDAFLERFPALATGNDAQRRDLTEMIVEQLVCEFPSDSYVWKSASPNRPPSKDAIGRLVNGRLYIWDWQNGSTRKRQVKAGSVAEDVTGQNPIERNCVDRLGSVPSQPVPVPPTPAPQPPAASDDVLDLLASLESKTSVAAHEATQAAERAARIEGKVDAITVSLEEHREEARKTRASFMKILKELAPYATAALAYFLKGKK